MLSRDHRRIAVLFLAPLGLDASAPVSKERDLERRFAGAVRPFVETYCLRCHSGTSRTATWTS